MKDFKIRVKAGSLDGLTEDRDINTKIFILSEGFQNKMHYLFIGNRGLFPAFPLGEPWGEGFGGPSEVHSYDKKRVEYFSYVDWTRKEWKKRFEGKYKENIIAHVKEGKIVYGNKSLLEKAGISIIHGIQQKNIRTAC